jgi:hypothetical protein
MATWISVRRSAVCHAHSLSVQTLAQTSRLGKLPLRGLTLAPTSTAPTYRGMPWRVSRRDPPAGFILPCRPTLVAAPAGPGWLHEMKPMPHGARASFVLVSLREDATFVGGRYDNWKCPMVRRP